MGRRALGVAVLSKITRLAADLVFTRLVCYDGGVSPRENSSKRRQKNPVSSADPAGRCTALAQSGRRCGRKVVPGLTVCSVHGGGTRASVAKGKRVSTSRKLQSLWGLSSNAGSISVEQELNKLAHNKITDITALRIELGSNPEKYQGMIVESYEETDNEVNGYTIKKVKRNKVHPLVDELHRAEKELATILRMIKEVGGEVDDQQLERIRLQTARETARLVKSYPGMGIDEAAAEVTRRV